MLLYAKASGFQSQCQMPAPPAVKSEQASFRMTQSGRPVGWSVIVVRNVQALSRLTVSSSMRFCDSTSLCMSVVICERWVRCEDGVASVKAERAPRVTFVFWSAIRRGVGHFATRTRLPRGLSRSTCFCVRVEIRVTGCVVVDVDIVEQECWRQRRHHCG